MAVDNPDIGGDFTGVDDLDYSLTVVYGRRALAEAVARRWLEAPGGLLYAPDYGQGLDAYLLSDVDPSLAGKLEQEAFKDERVESIEVRVDLSRDGVLTITGRIEDGSGPFDLTVAYDGLKAALLIAGEG